MKLRILPFCLLSGLAMSIAALGAGHFAWWWLAGMVMAVSFVPVAMFGPRGFVRQFGAVMPVLLIVSVLCTWSEAHLFFPAPEMREQAMRDLFGELVMYMIVGVVLAAMGMVLKLNQGSVYSITLRGPGSLVALVAAAGLIYLAFYVVTGGITYQFFTKQYFPNAEKMIAPLGAWFWVIQFGRGVLMTLAVLPIICTLRMSRMNTAIVAGMLLWVAGGLALLIPPNPLMGSTQRFIHTIEILTQNFPLGFLATLLMRPKAQT